jgi:Holliday junction resolvasome RuvABC endonuclease subunit
MKLIEAGLCRTVSERGKAKKVLAADDNFRRAKEIAAWLIDVPDIDLICAESMSFPRNASNAAKMALCWGVIAGYCQDHGVPLAQASPSQIKRRLCGAANVSDEDLRAALEEKFPGATAMINKAITAKSHRQHAWDALGAIWACHEGELFMLLRRTT